MERSEERENQFELDLQAREEPVTEDEEKKGLPNNNFPVLQWERVLLRQVAVCTLIILLLWLIGKVPRFGPGLVDRFRYVLRYGESNRTEEKLTAFARDQWQKIKDEVSSWFITAELQPVFAPSSRSIELTAPIYYYEERELSPQRIRFLLSSGSSVYASGSGIITEITGEKGGWKLCLDHGEGWYSIYYPCPRVYVKVGQWVKHGEEMASTGREFYWEITNSGIPVDPRPFIEEAGSWH
ncbi:MAG TPA: M23 family metallopeptidase [Firmicutes bacterium]|jgi:murein DD-endopeptidase MepM/ murein hydrolase activator NlpD|nr:M23 family metallopeptidase [Bacillota bacterium]